MAFTETWVEDEPDGAVITISQLDNYQRQTRVAVRERLEGDPSNDLTGIFETDSFDDAPMPRAGSGRFHHGLAADIGDVSVQNGRGYFTTDDAEFPKLFHLHADGPVEIAYMPIDGSKPLTGGLIVNNTVAAAEDHQAGIIVQNIQTAGSYTVDNSYGIRILDGNMGAGVTVTTQYGLKIESMVDGVTNYAIHTGTGTVRFGGAVLIDAAQTVRMNGSLHLNLESAGKKARLFGTVDGDIFLEFEDEVTFLNAAGNTAVKVTQGRSVALGRGNMPIDATDGFLYMPEIVDDPTGAPTEIDGFVPVAIDMTAGRMWFYNHVAANWVAAQFA